MNNLGLRFFEVIVRMLNVSICNFRFTVFGLFNIKNARPVLVI